MKKGQLRSGKQTIEALRRRVRTLKSQADGWETSAIIRAMTIEKLARLFKDCPDLIDEKLLKMLDDILEKYNIDACHSTSPEQQSSGGDSD